MPAGAGVFPVGRRGPGHRPAEVAAHLTRILPYLAKLWTLSFLRPAGVVNRGITCFFRVWPGLGRRVAALKREGFPAAWRGMRTALDPGGQPCLFQNI